MSPKPEPRLMPRIIRFRDAPAYLGMDRNRFNAEVRPRITELPIGKQGVGFDRLELDAWVEDYKSCNGRPARKGDITSVPAPRLPIPSAARRSHRRGTQY